MANDPCPDPQDLEALLKLPAFDLKRRHLDECPRCRARVISFLEFVTPPPDLPGDLLSDADRTLRKALDPVILEGAEPRPAGVVPPFWKWLEAMTRPRAIAWAAAAVAVISIAGVSLRTFRAHTEAPFVLRGAAEHAASGAAGQMTLRAVAGTGGVQLSWSAVPGADAYEVHVFGTDLEEIARLPATAQTTATLTRAAIPPSSTAGAPALWKVVALKGGDRLQESPPAELRLP